MFEHIIGKLTPEETKNLITEAFEMLMTSEQADVLAILQEMFNDA